MEARAYNETQSGMVGFECWTESVFQIAFVTSKRQQIHSLAAGRPTCHAQDECEYSWQEYSKSWAWPCAYASNEQGIWKIYEFRFMI